MSDFEPKIIAFCCEFCAYTAADLAGSMRLEYPPNVRVVKIMCTGKIDILYLLKAFDNGVDAAFVAGGEEGDCHFLEGNIRAKQKVEYTKKLLDEIGIGGGRLEMFNIGASDAIKFVAAVEEMNKRAKELGPNPLRKVA
ncbi:MAG: hydrogenase iron-sulfur subunit [Deltaproteobacteria bacterium]|nr:hydrogenase iron-sulfur subunit [Deltaproteobacteria bacterium]